MKYRKKQKYTEFWYRPDVDSIYWVPLPPHLPRYLDVFALKTTSLDFRIWRSTSFDSSIFRLKGKKRDGWGKFEFIAEVK